MGNKGQPKRVFTPAEDEHVITWRGKKPAGEIGQDIGRSSDAVRRRWRVLGVAERRVPAAPLPEPVSEAEAIARFLESRGVTVCHPGTAAGLSTYERLFHAAEPHGGSLREQNARWHENRKKRVAR